MAAFYRTNAQSRVLEEAMMRFGIPYKVVGGTRFYDRREIKDAMAYLRAVANPADEVSVKRVAQRAQARRRRRQRGQARRVWRPTRACPFVEAMRHAHEAGLTGPAARGVASFVGCSTSCGARGRCEDEHDDTGPADVLQAALDGSGYLAELEAESTVEAAGRIENLGELVGSAREFTRLDEFLEQVALVADTDELDDDNKVVLMTLHSAKGLEFPVGVPRRHGGRRVPPHPGAQPSRRRWRRSAASPTSASPAPSSGCTSPTPGAASCSARTNYNPPSRFLDEIPAELVNEQGNVGGRSSYGRQSYRQRATYGGDPPPYRRTARATFDPDEDEAVRHRERVVDAAINAGQRAATPVAVERAGDRPARRRRRRAPVVRRGRDHRDPRAAATRPRPRSASATPAPSTSPWRGRR